MDESQDVGDLNETIENNTEGEKLLPQSQVNAIVQHAKEKAALKARREADEEYQRKIESLNASIQNQGNRNENVSREVDVDAIYQQVQERINQEQVEKHLYNAAEQYLSKMDKGKEIYNDFDEVMGDFDPTAYKELVFLVSGIDNAADVMYELSKNPSKLVMLDNLVVKNPRKAHAQLLNISKSISENNLAKNEANSTNIPAPLDRLQSSRVSGSNGKMNTTDLRSQPWLKG